MAQAFPKWANWTPIIAALVLGPAPLAVVAGIWYFGSPEYTDVGYQPKQPVPFSHKLHAGELGMDCRYCHSNVEKSHEANVPPTETCMNCHNPNGPGIAKDKKTLDPIRESFATGKPMEWVRVHKLPDYAYFDHSVHLKAGVGCASCHGNVAQMDVVAQAKPLSMGWCLDCHRNPEPHLRPLDQITNMTWEPGRDQYHQAVDFIKERNLNPPEDCSACHR